MKKYTFILSVILISLLAVGTVSASDSDNFTSDLVSSVKDSNIDNQIAVEQINDLEEKSLATEIGSVDEGNTSDAVNNQSAENGVTSIDTTVNTVEVKKSDEIQSIPAKSNVGNVLGVGQEVIVLNSNENDVLNLNVSEIFSNFNFTDIFNFNASSFFSGLNFTSIFDDFNITDFLNDLNFTELFKNWNITTFLDNFNFTDLVSGFNFTDLFNKLNFTELFNNWNITELLDNLNFTALFNKLNITEFLDNLNFTALFDKLNITGFLNDLNFTALFDKLNITGFLDNLNFTKLFNFTNLINIITKYIQDLNITKIINITDIVNKIEDFGKAILGIKSPTVIYADDLSVVYANSKKLVITLRDYVANPVSDKTVYVVLNDKKYTGVTNSNGKVSITVPNNLKPKTYVATITFAGDLAYQNSLKTAKVVVAKGTPKITAKSKTIKNTKKNKKNKKYSIVLKNHKNKAMNKVKVTIKVNGKTYTAVTNKNGKATFKITKLTKKGTFKSVITYKGNSLYKKVTKTVKIKIS